MVQAQEALVILGPETKPEARAAVANLAPILHSSSDRVFVVRSEPENIERIRQLPSVAKILAGTESEEALPPLPETDLLFSKAWLMSKQPKTRKGEGLAWDAPGFLPPDRK